MKQPRLWDTKILFVTGKGGVGKSTVAAAVALRESQRGRNVLLVELGEQSFYQGFFRVEPISPTPQLLAPRLSVARWDTESCLQEYIMHYLRVERLYKLFFENRVMRSLINAAPPLKELTLLGKVTSGIRKVGPALNFDLIVVDSFATGHTLSLLRAPRGIGEAIRHGPMGEQSRDIFRVITSHDLTRYLIVTVADEMPVTETLELYRTLKDEMKIEASIVCNRLLKPPVTLDEIKEMDSAVRESESDASDFVRYLATVMKRQSRNLERLQALNSTFELPLITDSKNGIDLATHIARELPA